MSLDVLVIPSLVCFQVIGEKQSEKEKTIGKRDGNNRLRWKRELVRRSDFCYRFLRIFSFSLSKVYGLFLLFDRPMRNSWLLSSSDGYTPDTHTHTHRATLQSVSLYCVRAVCVMCAMTAPLSLVTLFPPFNPTHRIRRFNQALQHGVVYIDPVL